MTIKGFDTATAGFVLSIIALLLISLDLYYAINARQKANRVETAFRAWCAGDTKVEACAQLDLPLELHKFK